MDADKLDNRQGDWYQNALNINYGTLSDNRLPRFISETKFRDKITIKTFQGDPKFRIYISGQILNSAPFIPGDPNNPSVNLYNANAQGVGSFVIDNVVTNDDTNDNFNDYTILIGRLTSGNFVGALTVGTASNRVEFDDFTIEDGNTVEVANLHSDGGVGQLQLGRKDGNATSPRILFNSSQLLATYNAKIEASGGNATAGSGALDVTVVDADAFTVNNQVVYNAGNIQFSSTNTPNYAVQRDGSGNFAAGTITANLTGAASLNVLKTGDTMTGALNITGAGSTLTVAGTANLNNTVNIANDLSVDSGVLFVDVSANEVGINVGTNPLSTLDVVGDDGLYIRSATNAVGAKIRMSDHVPGSNPTQIGTISYVHADSSTPASEYGNAFLVSGTESDLALKVTGDVIATRYMGIGIDREPDYTLEVNGSGMFKSGIYVEEAVDNSGAPIYFRGSSSQKNFRIGNQIGFSNAFEITPSTNNGGTSWATTPGLLVHGDSKVSINTSATSGTDPESNQVRNYNLNVQGDVNFNGQLFQNNAEFVTSRWTEASNTYDIYRLSKVGIGPTMSAVTDPTKELVVGGDIDIQNGQFKGDQTLTGGTQWFSPNYFGVDRAVVLDPQEVYGAVKFRRVNAGQYAFWVLIVQQTSSSNYTVKYGAKIKTPTGGTTGEILEFDFDAAIATIGSPELTPGLTYNLAWLSGNGGGSISGPSGSIYVDAGSGGLIDYINTNSAPTAGGTYTTTSNGTGNNIHMQLLPAKSTLSANGFEQWTDSYGMFKKCKQTIDETVVVSNGEFIVSFGELTIASGKEVTIENGGNWTIK